MNPEAQRIAIAEACGATVYRVKISKYNPKGLRTRTLCMLPDYLNDLNAMHEAEKELREPQVMAYILKLRDIVERIDDTGENGIEMTLIHLTAAQRAEAFLRTIGKWKAENE